MLRLFSVSLIALASSAVYGRRSESVQPLRTVPSAAGASAGHSVEAQAHGEEGKHVDFSLCAEGKPKSHSFAYKDVAGPPSEFAAMAQPQEASLSAYSGHFAAPFAMAAAAEATTMTYKQQVVVDSTSGFAIAAFVTDADCTYVLTNSAGKVVDLSKAVTQVSLPFGDDGFRAVKGTQWNFNTPPPQGVYTFTVTSTSPATITTAREERQVRKPSAPAKDGYILFWNESPEKLYAHVSNSNNPVVGKKVGVVARLVDSDAHPAEEGWTTSNTPPPVSAAQVITGTLRTTFPDGTTSTESMKDDGLNSDGLADDGEYGGNVVATQAGMYRFHASFTGQDAAGATFVRTYEQDMMVDSPSAKLTSYVLGCTDSKKKRLSIRMPVTVSDCAAKAATYRPFFELWGKSKATGEDVPISFSTSLAEVQSTLFQKYLPLTVDYKWIQAANATGPLTLKNVIVQNIATLAAVSEAESIPVSMITEEEMAGFDGVTFGAASLAAGSAELASTMAALPAYDGVITWEMRNGVAPPRLNANSGATGKLVLMHGFCADKNPFEMQPGDWTDAVYYSAAREGDDLGRSNHQFAEDVLGFIEREGLDTYGLVGQSQGGMISLHILNFYHTGLDDAVGERKIQSIATPYQGNTALSSLNGIIDIIGGVGGCSGPYDLTRSGAGEWLTGISPANLAEANYYYTEYSKGGLFGGGWCNTAMNLLLDGKNDGVCEVAYATPNGGGNDRGNTEGWCHAENMNWPPSFWDTPRNEEMSKLAAR